MNDATTTVAELRQCVRRFVEEREWSRFHDPKNLAMSIAIEAAELMEHFQWRTNREAGEVRAAPEELAQVRAELADIAAYVLSFANALDIDLSAALREKLAQNASKYPADRFRGRFR